MGVAVQAVRKKWPNKASHSLNAALDKVASPLHLAGVALELELILACLTALEPKDTSVLAHEHHARARFDLFS